MKMKIALLAAGLFAAASMMMGPPATPTAAAINGGDLLWCACMDDLGDRVARAALRAECDEDAELAGYKAGTIRPKNPSDDDVVFKCLACSTDQPVKVLCIGHPSQN